MPKILIIEKIKKTKLNDEQESDNEGNIFRINLTNQFTALRVRWSPIEEHVISLINGSLAFYLPRKQPNTPNIPDGPKLLSDTHYFSLLLGHPVSQDSTPIGSRRPAAFLPFNKELFRAYLIRILSR
ncbi:unnamed protein product [Rotaria sp. Silwood2]|nr:unnamed protein product [Rotaria sp. Silwood2]CAF4359803.1 unnamed protein product [Rotaria sp. Silwood2]